MALPGGHVENNCNARKAHYQQGEPGIGIYSNSTATNNNANTAKGEEGCETCAKTETLVVVLFLVVGGLFLLVAVFVVLILKARRQND